jgi:hypothetical protein
MGKHTLKGGRRMLTNKEIREMYERLGLKTLPILEPEPIKDD